MKTGRSQLSCQTDIGSTTARARASTPTVQERWLIIYYSYKILYIHLTPFMVFPLRAQSNRGAREPISGLSRGMGLKHDIRQALPAVGLGFPS
jgi:hypothetical protein